MMAHLSFACIPLFLLAAFVASPFVFCSHQGSVDAAEASNGQRAADKQRATELLNEFAGENDVAGLMAEYTNTPAPYVLVGEDRDDCPLVEGAQAAPVAVFLRHSQGVSTAPTLTIDSTGRSSGPCPKVFLQEIPYYGRKAAATSMGTGLPTTLGDLKRTVDLTRLGLDREFNEKAYQSLRVCNDFFFSGSGNTRSSSDPACVVAQLDEAAVNIRALDTERLSVLHPRLKAALVFASTLAFTRDKKEWIRKLITSSSLRLAWHVVDAFAGMNVNMLEANVGEALNSIVLKDLKLLLPLTDLIQFGLFSTIYDFQTYTTFILTICWLPLGSGCNFFDHRHCVPHSNKKMQ